MTRVRFVRAKRYPHPDGPKRPAGAVLLIEDEWADHWARVGIVEHAPTQEASLSELTVKELREMASDAGVDVPTNARKADLIAALSN